MNSKIPLNIFARSGLQGVLICRGERISLEKERNRNKERREANGYLERKRVCKAGQ